MDRNGYKKTIKFVLDESTLFYETPVLGRAMYGLYRLYTGADAILSGTETCTTLFFSCQVIGMKDC